MVEKIKEASKSGIMQLFALIFVAIIFNTNTSSFVVIMADIAEAFKPQGMTTTQLSMMQTLPTLVMIPSILFSGWLLTRVSKKWIVVSGWLVYGLCGFALYFVQDYRVFLVVRGLMGVGLGLVNPQSRSMIAQVLSGDKVASTMGYLSMFGGFISFSISIGMGYIAAANWRNGLLLFPVFTLIAVVLALAFIPTLPVEPKKAQLIQEGKNEPYGKFVFSMWMAGFCIFCIATVIQVRTAPFVRELGLGSTTLTGWVSAAASLGTFFGGWLFGFWHKKFHRWTFPIACAWAAVGYFTFCTAHSIPQLLIGAGIAANGSLGSLMPYLTSRVALAAPVTRKSMAITTLTILNFLGQFSATYYIMFVDKVMGKNAALTLGSVSVSFAILSIAGFIFVAKTKKENEEFMQRLQASKPVAKPAV